jgi:hypothetical protein
LTRYEFLLFLHIAFAVIWVGGAAMFQFFGLRVLASGDANRLAEFAGNVEWAGSRVLVPAALGACSPGSAWSGIRTSVLAGAGFFGPESGRVKKLIDTEGAAAAQRRVKRLIALTRIDLMILFLLILDMSVKPSFEDGWTLVGAVAVAAALAALFTVPTLRATPATSS